MSEFDERVREVRDNTFGSTVQPGRNGFVKRGYLSNLHRAGRSLIVKRKVRVSRS